MTKYEYIQYKALSIYPDAAVVNELKEIREEIAQIKATKIYSTIDFKDMILEIIDKHIKEE